MFLLPLFEQIQAPLITITLKIELPTTTYKYCGFPLRRYERMFGLLYVLVPFLPLRRNNEEMWYSKETKCSLVTKVLRHRPLIFGKTKFLSQIGVDTGLCSGVLQTRSSRANESEIDEPRLERR